MNLKSGLLLILVVHSVDLIHPRTGFAQTTGWDAIETGGPATEDNPHFALYVNLAMELAEQLARRALPPGPREDAVQDVGAILKNIWIRFDPGYKTKLRTYFTARARGRILDTARGSDYLPRALRERLNKIEKATQSLNKPHPSSLEIAAAAGLTLREVLYPHVELLSGNLTVRSEDGETDLQDLHPSLVSEPPDDVHMYSEVLPMIYERLDPNEQRIFYMYYWEGLSFREIGEIVGLTESRVCKIHGTAIDRLRHFCAGALDPL